MCHMADVAKAFKGLSENVRQMVESRDVLRNGDFLRNRGRTTRWVRRARRPTSLSCPMARALRQFRRPADGAAPDPRGAAVRDGHRA